MRAYQWGISIQIKALSGHKQQEAKQDPGAAEWEDGRDREKQTESESKGMRVLVVGGDHTGRNNLCLGAFCTCIFACMH